MMTRLRKELHNNSDQKYREFNRGLLPGVENILGVRIPVLRNMAAEIMERGWRSFLDEDVVFHEEYILKAIVIANAEMSYKERLERTVDFLPHVDNWAICDLLCNDWRLASEGVGSLWNFCEDMMSSNDEFKMRTGAVMMLSKFLDDRHIDGVLKLLSESHNDGYYYKMGAAWALSYCYIDFQEVTEEVLSSGKLDREVQNLTVRKVCESRRADGELKKQVRTFKR